MEPKINSFPPPASGSYMSFMADALLSNVLFPFCTKRRTRKLRAFTHSKVTLVYDPPVLLGLPPPQGIGTRVGPSSLFRLLKCLSVSGIQSRQDSKSRSLFGHRCRDCSSWETLVKIFSLGHRRTPEYGISSIAERGKTILEVCSAYRVSVEPTRNGSLPKGKLVCSHRLRVTQNGPPVSHLGC